MMPRRMVSPVLAVAMLGLIPAARGQSDTSKKPGLTMQRPFEQQGPGIVKDALGHPCLNIEAAARAQTVNPDMRDHVVSIKNNCVKLIKAKVCYFNTDHCNEVDLPAYKRVDTVLGSMRDVTFFRYSISQK